MKITLSEHSRSTKVSDLLLVIFSVAYFVLGFCLAKDFFACFLFLLCVLIIVLIKYLRLSESEKL